MTLRHRIAVTATFGMGVLVAIALGSASIASASTSSSEVAAARSRLVQFEKLPVAASIPAKATLPSKPPPEKIAVLGCEIANCTNVVAGMTAASKALNWSSQVFDGLSTNPAAGWPQMLASDPKYIMTFNGLPTASYGQQLAQAKAANIPVFACYGPDTPTGKSGNGIYSECGAGVIYKTITPELGSEIIAASDGKANVVHVLLSQAGTFGVLGTDLTSYLKKNCSGCTFSTLPITFTQITAGTVGSAVLTYLQSHPKTTDVLMSYAEEWPSTVSSLQSGGYLSKVRLETIAASGFSQPFDDIANGKVKGAVIAQPSSQFIAWTEMDVAARESVGASTTAVQEQTEPTYLIATKSEAQKWVANPWQGPANYQAYFKKLWKE